jgi:hypothetical protein
MSCEHLICAQCAGPVAEGRCPTCREARAQIHHHGHGMSVQLIAAAALLILALLTVAAMHLGH